MGLRILSVFSQYRYRGGEAQVVEAETRLLAEHGCQVVPLIEAPVDPNGFVRKIEVAMNTIWSGSGYTRVKNAIRDSNPDLAHVHNFFPAISPSVYYACRDYGVPVVQTLHNYRFLCPGANFFRNGNICKDCITHSLLHGVWHGCYRESRSATLVVASMLEVHRILRTWDDLVDCYITPSEFTRQIFIRSGLPAAKVVVKPNFISIDPGERISGGAYALYIGRLSLEKGLPTLLNAWKLLPESIPLYIVGEGPLRGEAEMAERSDARVHFSGAMGHEEAITAVKGACFIIYPSTCYETFGLGIAEAFGCGVPVICSGHGAMAEIVEDGVTGLHFRPADEADLAAKVKWAWSHPPEMRRMGRQARRVCESRYAAQTNYELLMNIYSRVLQGRMQVKTSGARSALRSKRREVLQ